jgi:uncharacterized protein (DUF488 family)
MEHHLVEIYTIGHSNRSAEQLLSLLTEFEIKTLADIRRFSSSRKNPHFNLEPLRQLLEGNGVNYEWFEELGGRRRRRATAGSPNALLRSPGFRNYADYMMTDEFRAGIRPLLDIARARRTAVMCAELLYWRCHRMLFSDYLFANGWAVLHILDHGQVRRHELLKGALVRPDKSVIYPPANEIDFSSNEGQKTG